MLSIVELSNETVNSQDICQERSISYPMKRFYKLFLSIFLFTFCFGLYFSMPISAQQLKFSISGPQRMDSQHKQFNFKDNKEKLKFVYDDKFILKLMSRDNKHDYLSFLSYRTGAGAYSYVIRTIKTNDPNRTFYEIKAVEGIRGGTFGYWLIGRYKDSWVTFISLDHLIKLGFDPLQENVMFSEITPSGKLIFINKYSYMPPGGRYGYQRRQAINLRLEFFWDEDAQWFGMRKLPL